jgi:2-hydroxychromene-2-carboxylate isomerase
MPVIDYFLSLNSPWTYLGSARFIELARRYGVAVAVKPANFGEVFAETGGLPLSKRSPQRQAYRLMELERWRDELGIPIVIQPANFPSNERPGVHAVIAAARAGVDALAFSAEIGRALWEMDQNIAEPDILAAAAARAGFDLAPVLAAAPSPEDLDAAWAANTCEAIAKGVFGAPSYRFEDGQIMWGQDRLQFVASKLATLAKG